MQNSYRLYLAPMAGVTDSAFRAVCRAHGAEHTCTEMISAKAMVYRDKKTPALAKITADEAPCAVQIFGSQPEIMAEAARMLADGSYDGCCTDVLPAEIDINMGCPMPKVACNGDGSALMKSPALAGAIVSAVVRAVSLPVTVKIRAGWDGDSINAPEFAKRLEDAGASLVYVHGRTRAQMYAPSSDNKIIAAVKAAVGIPVVGNGDIFGASDAAAMLKETGCDGVMVARGALGNPWIFGEIKAELDKTIFTAPTLRERTDTALAQIRAAVADKGERTALLEARRHLSWYIRGIPGAADARDRINRAQTFAEMENIMYSLCGGDRTV